MAGQGVVVGIPGKPSLSINRDDFKQILAHALTSLALARASEPKDPRDGPVRELCRDMMGMLGR